MHYGAKENVLYISKNEQNITKNTTAKTDNFANMIT